MSLRFRKWETMQYFLNAFYTKIWPTQGSLLHMALRRTLLSVSYNIRYKKVLIISWIISWIISSLGNSAELLFPNFKETEFLFLFFYFFFGIAGIITKVLSNRIKSNIGIFVTHFHCEYFHSLLLIGKNLV